MTPNRKLLWYQWLKASILARLCRSFGYQWSATECLSLRYFNIATLKYKAVWSHFHFCFFYICYYFSFHSTKFLRTTDIKYNVQGKIGALGGCPQISSCYNVIVKTIIDNNWYLLEWVYGCIFRRVTCHCKILCLQLLDYARAVVIGMCNWELLFHNKLLQVAKFWV